MISDFFVDLLGSIFDFLLSGMPTIPVPDWLQSTSAAAGTVFSFVGSMAVWFPTQLAFVVMGSLIATWLVCYGVHISRMVISLFTGGGGKA